MDELIQSTAFSYSNSLEPHVRKGHYDLIGPNGEIILEQVWETVIEPDWAVTMQMWPLPEGEISIPDEAQSSMPRNRETSRQSPPVGILEENPPDVEEERDLRDTQIPQLVASLDSLVRRLTKEERRKLPFPRRGETPVEHDPSLSNQAKLQTLLKRVREVEAILDVPGLKESSPVEEPQSGGDPDSSGDEVEVNSQDPIDLSTVGTREKETVPRRRERFTLEERARVAEARKGGPCSSCRGRKLRVSATDNSMRYD